MPGGLNSRSEPASLESLRIERDEALQALALERARMAAHLLHCPESSAFKDSTLATDVSPPLRHRLVDAANGSLKRYLTWVHGSLRAVVVQVERALNQDTTQQP